jgi:hypothetical protein
MNKNKMMLIASTFILALGSAFVNTASSTKRISSFYQNTTGCPISACGPVGALTCGGTFYLVGCTVIVTNAKYPS